ncbi:MAG TPA: AI-2E family transporter [Acidimicrobiales bacterium]|jgi:predicted PurR-regulated permease PerM|nr:AI-2E family transporter [Acidimicrobiales bacterium]
MGPQFDRKNPFIIGLLASLGAAVAFGLVWFVVSAAQVLTLLGLAFFIAVGLDPAVTFLARRVMPRWAAVTVIILALLGVVGLFLALAIPVIVTQATRLADNLPGYMQQLQSHNSTLGKLNARYHIVPDLQKLLNGSGGSSGVTSGVMGVGKAVIGAVTSAVLVLTVAVYALADMPRIKRGLYLLSPRSRRARMILITDEILGRVGGYVLGNLAISVVSFIGTWVWCLIWGIPYGLLLGLLVGLLDLVPIIGSTIGGVVVALVALSVSLPVAIATVAFYIIYRFAEDYLLTPKVMGRTVDVPGLVTVVATVIGGAVLGIVGALVAIPLAAGIKLLLHELAKPRLEQM